MAKYIKVFQTHSEYVEDAANRLYPNVSHCIQQNDVHYNPTDPTARFYYQGEIVQRCNVEFKEGFRGWGYYINGYANPGHFDKVVFPLTEGGEVSSVTVNHPDIRQLTYTLRGNEVIIEDVEGSWGIDGGGEFTQPYTDIGFAITHTTQGHECTTRISVNPGVH